jgi:hypothetical protein
MRRKHPLIRASSPSNGFLEEISGYLRSLFPSFTLRIRLMFVFCVVTKPLGKVDVDVSIR